MIRYAVREQFATLLRQVPTFGPTSIAASYDGVKSDDREMAYGEGTEGEVTFPTIRTEPLSLDDQFTLTWNIDVVNGSTMDATAQRVEELVTGALEMVAASPTLGSFSSSGETVISVQPETVRTREGEDRNGRPIAQAQIDFRVHTRN